MTVEPRENEGLAFGRAVTLVNEWRTLRKLETVGNIRVECARTEE